MPWVLSNVLIALLYFSFCTEYRGVADSGCLYRISDPNFCPSRVSDPGSKKGTKEKGGKNLLSYLFLLPQMSERKKKLSGK